MNQPVPPFRSKLPAWLQLTTPEVTDSWAFYADVLDWTIIERTDDHGGPSEGLAIADDDLVATIVAGPEAGEASWLVCFAVDDLTEAAAAVHRAGGTVLLPVSPGDAGPLVGQDPTGAVFGLVPKDFLAGIPEGELRRPGRAGWLDLMSEDPAAARAFYGAVLGWEYLQIGDDLDQYAGVIMDDGPGAGIGKMANSDADGPRWRVYISVDDTDDAAHRVLENGGQLLSRPQNGPLGRVLRARDPQGAEVILIDVGAEEDSLTNGLSAGQ